MTEWLSRAAASPPVPRPGESLPAGSNSLSAAPAPDRRAGGRGTTAAGLRRSLDASCAEGMVAEVCGACAGGAVLTAWAIHAGADARTIGLLGALPLAAQVLQLPAARLTRRFGCRRVGIAAIGASRLVWLPLALVVFAEPPRAILLPLLVLVVAIAAVLGVVGNNAWISWMGDLVPAHLRGRFFGRRTALLSIAGTIASLTVGFVLDTLGSRGLGAETLSALAGIACVAGGASIALLLRHADPGAAPPPAGPRRDTVSAVLRDPVARPFLVYLLAWNGAVGLSAGFFSFHMLGTLQTGFTLAAAHGVVVACARIVSAPLWGRVVDGAGARPVVQLCSLGIAFVPALWLVATPDRIWPLAIEAVLAGVFWSGHGIATLDLTIGSSPRAARPAYTAVFAAAGGIGFAATSVLAGALAAAVTPPLQALGAGWTGLHALFALSAIARLAASLLCARIAERGARGVDAVLDALAAEVVALSASVLALAGVQKRSVRPSA